VNLKTIVEKNSNKKHFSVIILFDLFHQLNDGNV